MRWLPLSLISCVLLLNLCHPVLALDQDLIRDPQVVTFTNHNSERHWQALFDPWPRQSLRHLIALSKTEPQLYPSLISARLLYRGNPWTRRGDESGITSQEWRRRCQPLLIAALRELRLHDEADLLHVDIALLASESDPEMVTAILVDLLRRDETVAKAGAARIAQPAHAEALPGARNPESRRLARALMMETWGLTDPETHAALRAGLQSPLPRERNAALQLLTRGQADADILPVLLRLAKTCADNPSDADLDGFRLACDRSQTLDDATAQAVITLALTAQRNVATQACALLERSLPPTVALPTQAILDAASTDTDRFRQHARMSLLLRRAPTAIPDSDEFNTWHQLADHRQAVMRWNAR